MKLILLAALLATCSGWLWRSEQQVEEEQLPVPQAAEKQGIDFCSLDMHELVTFDEKRLSLPRSSCEILLTERCKNDGNNLRVTMKSSFDLMGFKELNIVSGNDVIKAKAEHFQINELIVNGVKHVPRVQSLYMKLKDSYISWHDNKFLWSSRQPGKPGTNIYVNGAYLSLQVDSAITSEFGCGLCKPRLELPQHLLSGKAVKYLVKHESFNDKCSIGKPIREQPSVCSKDDKYMMGSLNGLTCITEERQPVCNDRCSKKIRHWVTAKARCVHQNLMFMGSNYGNQRVVENDRVIIHVLNSGVRRELLIYPSQECS